MEAALNFIKTVASYLLDILTKPFELLGRLLVWLLGKLADWFVSLPTPDVIAQLAGYKAGIPSTAIWWLTVFELPTGLLIIVGLLILRFVIRRIPIIG